MIAFQEMSKMLKTQELENAQQATIIRRLEEAVISKDRKYKTGVLESGKNKSILGFLN